MIQRINLTRAFLYAGVTLPDPDASMTPVQVRDFFAAAGRPELATAEIRGPEQVGTTQQFTFHRAVGTKGFQKTQSEPITSHEQLKALTCNASVQKAMVCMVGESVQPNHTVNRVIGQFTAPGGRVMTLPKSAVRWFF